MGEGMGTIDIRPNDIRPIDFRSNDVVSLFDDFLHKKVSLANHKLFLLGYREVVAQGPML